MRSADDVGLEFSAAIRPPRPWKGQSYTAPPVTAADAERAARDLAAVAAADAELQKMLTARAGERDAVRMQRIFSAARIHQASQDRRFNEKGVRREGRTALRRVGWYRRPSRQETRLHNGWVPVLHAPRRAGRAPAPRHRVAAAASRPSSRGSPDSDDGSGPPLADITAAVAWLRLAAHLRRRGTLLRVAA